MTDVAAGKAWLKQQGATEIALVGASMGGHAVLGSSFDPDVEQLVQVAELIDRIYGRTT